MDLKILAEDLTGIYDMVDPYETRPGYETREEAARHIGHALKEWPAGDIRRVFINDLKGYVDDGLDDDGSIADAIARLEELAEVKG